MIPIKLQLRNFLCYRDNVPPIYFEGLHVVCLAGDNGNGKTALLDAITWALWAKARADDRELLHFGRTEMEVEFEFALGDDRYRVIRKRSLKPGGKTVRTQTAVDFQIASEGVFRSIAGNNADETNRKIIETLRMNYHTFINSAFLRQGRADEFTAKTPGERKEVLGDILGLGEYDVLAERAKKQKEQREKERLELSATTREIDRELERKPEYEQHLAAVRAEMSSLEAAIATAEKEIAVSKSRKAELDIKAGQLANLETRVKRVQNDMQEMQGQLRTVQVRIGEFEALLAEKSEIEQGFAGLAKARMANDELNEKMSCLVKFKDHEATLAQVITEARNALITEQKVLASNLASLEKRASQSSSLEEQLGALRKRLDCLQDLDARRDELREAIQTWRNQIQLLKATNAQLKHDMEELKKKLDFVGSAGSTCPLCESDLGPSGRERISAKFKDEGLRMAVDWRSNNDDVGNLEKEIRAAEVQVAEIEQQIRERGELQRRLTMVETALADAREAELQANSLKQQLSDVEQRLEREDYAATEKGVVAGIRLQMRELGYDEDRHREVRAAAANLQRYEGQKQHLDGALERIGDERANLERIQSMLARWQEGLEADLAQRLVLVEALRDLDPVQRQIDEAERGLETLLRSQADTRMRLGQAQQMLNHCRYLENEKAEKATAMARAAEEEGIYRELQAAFGKNGVQAMIIDSAVPEIEAEANTLLTRMTDGRLHVTLETQKEQLDGGLKETLQIKVGDELGIRGYDTYSGGEAFRINFALRVALSKLLARRAGARLQTLVVDEGFGSLDVAGRDSLVEAINSVSDDFEKIIVITHIQELKDAFPSRIDVIKDADGSQVVVS